MTQDASHPGFIDAHAAHSLRVLDELAQIGERVCDQLVAQALTNESDTVWSLLAHARLARECRKTVALRDKIKEQAARRTAPGRRRRK
jgi:SOS response regulatory protein OraA/RecX